MQSRNRLVKLGVVFALMLGVFFAGLAGGNRSVVAQDMEGQTYHVLAGSNDIGNAELLAFSPSTLQIHRGDTVMWHILGFHNVHFGEEPVDFFIFPADSAPQVNPAVAFPTIENGGTYTGGEVNSGLPEGQFFTLTFDAEPGTYAYRCDVHPGMAGVIEVVADDVEIPSPSEVTRMAREEVSGQIFPAVEIYIEAVAGTSPMSSEGTATVMAGSGNTGRVTINQFAPFYTVIQAGETVTWTNPADGIEPHFVNSFPYSEEEVPDIVPQPQEGAPPILTAGPGFLGTTESGAEIGAGDTFNSPFLFPGQSFSLTFTEPGVYPYVCHIHPGMNGVVVVQPAA